MIPIWYDPLDNGESFYTSPDAEGIPALRYDQFLKQVKGELPTDEMWDRLSPAQCGRYVLPARPRHAAGNAAGRGRDPPEGARRPGNDADYKADAMKTVKFVPRFLTDDKTLRLFHNIDEYRSEGAAVHAELYREGGGARQQPPVKRPSASVTDRSADLSAPPCAPATAGREIGAPTTSRDHMRCWPQSMRIHSPVMVVAPWISHSAASATSAGQMARPSGYSSLALRTRSA